MKFGLHNNISTHVSWKAMCSKFHHGKPTSDSTSVLLHFQNAEVCCIYIQQLAFFMHCNQYDLTKIKGTNVFSEILQSDPLQKTNK